LLKKIEKLPVAVVFDMDGLMFDSERIIQISWNQAGQKMGYGALGDDNVRNTLGFNNARRRQYFLGAYGEDFPYEEFRRRYRLEFAAYVDEHGLPAKKGLHELLEALKRRGISMAVATSSSREYALGNITREGIESYFQTIITGDMVKKAKPDPEIYVKACEALGVDPQQAMALEDSYHGIRSAYQAGMLPVMVPDLLRDISPVETLLAGCADSLLEVAEWF
jgi:HAD superfamily hydrolase (TIGR01509 family)